jgi:bifunctional DNA-binding transcriptional regulator/antitoxin component of YhaV-PrlF toxin-antitoxin module
MRRRFGIDEGSLVIAEERDDGILIRPPSRCRLRSPPVSVLTERRGTGSTSM